MSCLYIRTGSDSDRLNAQLSQSEVKEEKPNSKSRYGRSLPLPVLMWQALKNQKGPGAVFSLIEL